MKLLAATLMIAAVSGEAPAPAPAPAPDVGRGEAIYAERCETCHGVNGDGQAVTLVGVVGRRAASVSGMVYSRPLSASGLTWTPAVLDRFLTDPLAMVPGTAMPVAVPDPKDRADLIAYLASRGS